MKKIVLGSLILVLLVSGCANFPLPDIWPFGQPKVNTTRLGPDVIIIQNLNVIPRSAIRPSDSFSVYYEVKNQEENEMISGVKYHLYDTGLCTFVPKPNEDNPTTLIPLGNGDFAPSETKLIEWNFNAPSELEIASLSITCPIKFKINYQYSAKTQVDIGLINSERLKDLQRAGKDVTYTPNQNIGRGPIKIYFDFGNTLPVRNNSNFSFYVKVKDEGAGLLGEISNRSDDTRLFIEVPHMSNKFTDLSCLEDDYFDCSDTGTMWSCKNSKKSIPLIQKETFEIKCVLQTPASVNEEETRYINARIKYNYDVLGTASIQVKP